MKHLYRSLVLFSLIAVPGLAEANISSGQVAPDFALTDINGKPQKLSAYKGKYVVLEWFNSECPFVQKHYESGNMQSLQRKFGNQGVVWLTINSTNPNSSNYRDPARSREIVNSWKIQSAALILDVDGKVGRMFGATATPHMWVIEPSGKVVFAGGIDDKATYRHEDVKTAKNFVASALEDAMAGRAIGVAAAPPYGCSIKY